MEPYDIIKNQNTGVVIDIRPRDFVAGAETGVAAPILEPLGQFDLYLPDEESQWKNLLDSYACVTFSALNCLEILFNRKLARGEFSAEQVAFLKNEGYIDQQTNKINFSDRYTAKMSGTSKNGNSLGVVGDSIRTLHGLIPEKEWAWPEGLTDSMPLDQKWATYYAEIPAELIAKGKRFLEHFVIKYQWVLVGTGDATKIKSSLTQGPIQIAAAVCSPWNSTEAMPPIPACACSTQHATTLYGFHDDGVLKDFDHYRSFKKLLAADYCIQYAMQYYLEDIAAPTAPAPVIGYKYSKNLRAGAPDTTEVRMMQAGLQYAKDKTNTPYMKPGTFGPFGPQTKDALGRFQTDRGIKDPDGQGTNFGPATRAALTLAVSK